MSHPGFVCHLDTDPFPLVPDERQRGFASDEAAGVTRLVYVEAIRFVKRTVREGGVQVRHFDHVNPAGMIRRCRRLCDCTWQDSRLRQKGSHGLPANNLDSYLERPGFCVEEGVYCRTRLVVKNHSLS